MEVFKLLGIIGVSKLSGIVGVSKSFGIARVSKPSGIAGVSKPSGIAMWIFQGKNKSWVTHLMGVKTTGNTKYNPL